MLFDISFLSIAGLTAGFLSFTAYILYMVTTVWGKTRPNRVTWWILTVVNLIILTSYYSIGARDTVWIPASYVLGSLIIALLSLRYGEGGWSRFDQLCACGAGVSIALWWLFTAPFLALLASMSIDFLGLLPTVRKSFLRPHTEDRTAWTLDFFASAINLFAVEHWIFDVAVYPIYLVLMNGLIAALLFRKRRRIRVTSRV